jgi:SAM-dependent methyltransferase
VEHLTEFYIWMSVGGSCGGVLNTLIAPQIFSTILEYPLLLGVATLLRPSPRYRDSRPEPLLLISALPALILVLCVSLWAMGLTSAGIGLRPMLLAFGIVFAVASMLANRVAVFGLTALAFVGVIAFGRPSEAGSILRASRSFFGVYRVIEAPDARFHVLQHGSTTHGRQEWPAATACDPTGYYHPASPIGDLFRTAERPLHRVAVVGLGTGALACYAGRGDAWTFYEIDPVVERLARDPREFTYLKNTPGRVNVVLGDGRLMLQHAAAGIYDVIILDAFSSDAIPVHLLTREAIALYFSKLQPGGVLAVHISNRYINLEPVLGGIAALDDLPAVAKVDDDIPAADEQRGRFPSQWVLIARSGEVLAAFSRRPGWRPAVLRRELRPWTDDYSNILQVLARY